MAIHLQKCMKATIQVGQTLTKEEQEQLAGDIQNWLQTHKSIICNVKVY